MILTHSECCQIADVLKRSANEIARFYDKGGFPDSVGCALLAEIARLRALADRVSPEQP